MKTQLIRSGRYLFQNRHRIARGLVIAASILERLDDRPSKSRRLTRSRKMSRC